MMLSIARFASIVLTSLVAGGMFAIWAGYDPAAFSPSTYVEQQQNAIRGLNVLFPVLGGLAIFFTLGSAWLQKNDRGTFVLLIVAAAFLTVSGLITRLGNQPINDVVITWNAANPPATWTEARDHWWALHRMRTLSGLLALGAVAWANAKSKGRRA